MKRPREGLKPKYGYYSAAILLMILFAFIFAGCLPNKNSKPETIIHVTQLPVKYSSDFKDALAIGQTLPSDKGGPFLTQDLLTRGAWHKVSIYFPGDLKDFYLDVGMAPTGIKKLAYYNENFSKNWIILTGSNIPERYIGPFPAIDKKAIVYIQTQTPVPMKIRLKIAREKATSIWKDTIPFIYAFTAILSILFIQMFYFYLVTKDRIYLFFKGVLLGHAGYFLYYTGVVHLLLPEGSSPFSILFYPAIIYFVFFNLAFSKLFHLKQRIPNERKVLQYFNYFYFLLMAFYAVSGAQYDATNIYFIISAVNSIVLLVFSLMIMLKGTRFEQVLCLLSVILQVHSVFLAIYRSGIENLLNLSDTANIMLYNFTEGASLFIFFLFITGMFLGSISARYGQAYNQHEIMEDEFFDLPEKVQDERKRIASGSKNIHVPFAPAEVENLKRQLNHLLTIDKIYRKPDLALTDLAQMLQMKPWKVSLFINEHMKTNFRDLIASHRIEDVQQSLLQDDDINILRIAMDAGFESKSAFYRIFSRRMGMTPMEFRKKKKISV